MDIEIVLGTLKVPSDQPQWANALLAKLDERLVLKTANLKDPFPTGKSGYTAVTLPKSRGTHDRAEASIRADLGEAYEAIISNAQHAELIRDILVEVTLLTDKYRRVRRHGVPHVVELAGLLDVLWQEVDVVQAKPRGLLDIQEPHIGDIENNDVRPMPDISDCGE